MTFVDRSNVEEANASDTETQAYNQTYASRLKKLAWAIEIVLVTVGLGIAFAQATASPEGSGYIQMFPVFGVFVVLAVVELAKIPAATVVFHAKGWRKMLPFAGLALASLISFETIFNGYERYAHETTKPVVEAKSNLIALEGDKERLLTTELSGETDGSRVAELDEKRVADQRDVVARAADAAQRARDNLDSEETKELKTQLSSLLDQQNQAGNEADKIWIDEQKWINERLKDGAIDAKTRDQLNRRMRDMPARQSFVNEERAKFDDSIAKINTNIEASITVPSPEAVAILEAAEIRLKSAQEQLNTFEQQADQRASSRIDDELAAGNAAKARATQIEALEEQIVKAQRAIDEKSEISQLHRWAAFFYGSGASEVGEDQVKRTGAIFGLILGIVGALTGASVAMYSEWFRTRGIQPKIIEKKVPIEVIVEKEVEKIVEVEVPIIKYKYVPIPIGDDFDDAIDGILQALPKEAADELRAQMADYSKPEVKLADISETDLKSKEKTYARAA
ncbi:hypothetical protein AB9F26_21015 [Falsihalocynthiibacter sp. BN13B15]|uniref:hypothetical protein n=1 Tax=Falsihalocynthiibacter sp. BN13B15 TaxID=3240871 RepID=UPI00350F27C0